MKSKIKINSQNLYKINIPKLYKFKINKFWVSYFYVRLFYLFFDVFIYGHLTTISDTHNYLTSNISFSWNIFIDRTELTSFIGGILGKLFGGDNIFSNFIAMMISIVIIHWAVEKLRLRQKMNNKVLFLALCMPQLCIWTSLYSKECFCLYFCAVFGVLFINFMKGNYRLHFRDLIALYICLLFKIQFFPFILQGLIYIYIVNRLKLKNFGKIIFGLMILSFDLAILYILQPVIDEMSYVIHNLFEAAEAKSTRDNIFLKSGDFYRHAPLGMFIAFFGPTLDEMSHSITHLIAGIESLLTILLFVYILKYQINRIINGYINPYLFFIIFLTFTGICFIHYPVGIFNPGSAIRYRTDFIFLFFLIASPLLTENRYKIYRNRRLI